ncbi:MAG TPA: substrate-binding domain-containing protein, partial [Solirubrobacteraceae bacterium]|nr:substrate-binding domain-containing protein [Solirubrobacteraceae bacterium]
MSSKRLAVLPAALASIVAVAACGGSSGGGKSVRLVAYSTPQAAFAALIPAFQGTAAGKGVTFSQSYGASGDQSRAVLAGLPADVVDLSLEPDVTKLVAAGLVPAAWNANPTHGFVTDSVAVFLVRKGNPKHIQTWDDLVRPGVTVLTPNPFSSGSARWNVMAAYGSKLTEGDTPAQAQA